MDDDDDADDDEEEEQEGREMMQIMRRRRRIVCTHSPFKRHGFELRKHHADAPKTSKRCSMARALRFVERKPLENAAVLPPALEVAVVGCAWQMGRVW
eukprot:2354282-Rhodomonas_salina.1